MSAATAPFWRADGTALAVRAERSANDTRRSSGQRSRQPQPPKVSRSPQGCARGPSPGVPSVVVPSTTFRALADDSQGEDREARAASPRRPGAAAAAHRSKPLRLPLPSAASLPLSGAPITATDYNFKIGLSNNEENSGGRGRLLEAACITDPGQAIAPEPHRGNPELDHLRHAAIRPLEIRAEAEVLRRMTHGQLEARVPPDPRRGPRPGQRPARRLPGTVAHRPGCADQFSGR